MPPSPAPVPVLPRVMALARLMFPCIASLPPVLMSTVPVPSAWLFWIAAVIAGLCMGSSQSCGRALAGALAPSDRLAEFFGLWTFATRLAAIIGPLTYGAVTVLTAGNHRLAILATGVFFVLGYWLLRRVDMTRGLARALI